MNSSQTGNDEPHFNEHFFKKEKKTIFLKKKILFASNTNWTCINLL